MTSIDDDIYRAYKRLEQEFRKAKINGVAIETLVLDWEVRHMAFLLAAYQLGRLHTLDSIPKNCGLDSLSYD